MEKLPTPPTLEEHIFTGELVPAVMGGKWVAEAEELKIGYDGKAIAELSCASDGDRRSALSGQTVPARRLFSRQ